MERTKKPGMGVDSPAGELEAILPALRTAEEFHSVFAARLPAGDSFPGYELVREIHGGAQGVVYLARQTATRREVAIKVMRQGNGAGVHERTRFEREVHILAQLHHPNIVAIHDSGVASGRFYSVMDYIPGHPLDEFVDHRHLAIRPTLELFAKICGAVNAAHLRGVIHRDLKPSNIRVNPEGEPFVLDFGLARVSGSDMQDGSYPLNVTLTGQFVGSLPWASPEQASGSPDNIDVRTDVYSLGVVLYQILTGQFPYSISGGMRDVLDRILHTEPQRPSTIQRLIDHELETIILKCLHKDPTRRYQSAGELGKDIHRYLAGEAVEAKRDSAWYLVWKTARRHKARVGVIVAFVLLLLGGGAAVAISQRNAARYQHEVAEAWKIHAEVQSGLAGKPPRSGDRGAPKAADSPLHRRLNDLADRVSTLFPHNPEAEAVVRQSLGQGYIDLELYPPARAHLEIALALRQGVFGDLHADVAASLHHLGRVHWLEGNYATAEPLYRKALAIRGALADGDDEGVAESLNHLAACMERLSEYAEAEALNRRALDMRRRLFGENDRDFAASLNNLATVLMEQGRYAEAEPLLRQALTLMKNLHGEKDQNTARGMTSLASCLIVLGQFEEAGQLLHRSLVLKQSVYGDNHPAVAVTLQHLANLHYEMADYETAENYARQVLQIREQSDPNHPNTAETLALLGAIQFRRDDPENAEIQLRKALGIQEKRLPPEHWRTARTRSWLGATLVALGEYEDAEPILLQAYETLTAKRPLGDRCRRETIQALIDLYDSWDDPEKAQSWRILVDESPEPAGDPR